MAEQRRTAIPDFHHHPIEQDDNGIPREPYLLGQSQMNQEAADTAKHVGDILSAAVVLGALVSWLPPVAALLTIIWTAIRIFESKTVQHFVHRHKRH